MKLDLNDLVLIADPKVLAIPIIENREPMINLKDRRDIFYGPSPEIPNNQNYTLVRQSIYEKLKQAQASLPSQNFRFCLYEGYRSLDLQKFLFEKHYQQIKKLHPDWFERSNIY